MSEPAERVSFLRAGMLKKKSWIAIPLLLLLVLGGINIYKKIIWRESTDGVSWEKKAGKITAIKVELNSPAYLMGIRKGDVLYSINNNLIENKIDLVKNLWVAEQTGQRVQYQINREGDLLFPSLYLVKKGSNLIYFYLVLIGLTTLVIALVVFFNSKKALSMPYIYFYFLSLVLFCFYTFSPTGNLDFLDSTFYWIDKAAFLAFPPLLLHFFTIFPQRKKLVKNRPSSIFALYIPGFILLLTRIALHLPYFNNLDVAVLLPLQGTLEKLDLLHFTLFAGITLFIIAQSAFRPPSLLVKKQLKWIAFGLGIGVIPFSTFYAVPFLLGQIPSTLAELTVLLQALIPLTFAYSISRYKLMDFEVLLKKAATLVFSYFVIACFYFIVSSRTQAFSENKLNAIILGILAFILGATLFSPLKKLFQTLLDRLFYKRSYKYRKTLLILSKELGRERNLHNLSHSLLELMIHALSLQGIALLLPQENENRTFRVFSLKGELPSLSSRIHFPPDLYHSLETMDFLSYYAFTEKKALPKDWGELSKQGFFHFLPLKVEEKLIGCLGMGKKLDNSFLTSEDWELLTTVSSPVALALENATLYEQASIRAHELERLKDYSENIIESLTVGVVVLNQKGEVIGWNRVLEDTFQKKKEEVFGKNMQEVVGYKNFSALFPSDTQQDFRLLSEITLGMPEGEEKIFDIAKTPLLDNRMIPYGTIIVFEDITEKINLQQQLVTSEKLASIGLLSAGVAHEINTPLTGISSYIQLLQKKLTDSHYVQILEKIETQTDRVARIIKNLLNFSRNPSEISFHRVNLGENLQELISLIDYKLKTMNIQLEMNIPPLKPVWAQGERLQQAFINIILNALDAMPRGGTLKIDVFQTEEAVVVKIADTGTGIKKQHLAHIFDPFFTTKGIGKGTGLGLSIGYAIIKEHEGHITVESEVGKGSCFTISIPAKLDKKKTTPKTSMFRTEHTE